MNKRSIATMMFLIALALMVWVISTQPRPGSPLAYATFTPAPMSGSSQEAAYAAAQATHASGQSEILELSHQATAVSLKMNQAADVAAQATLDYYQRELIELSIQSTQVSENMARAAATQQFITEQTEMAWNVATTAQSQAATATYSAYILDITQTAQAQAILDAHVAETAQANATRTAYSLTATPAAAIQADIARARNESDRRASWEEYIVNISKVTVPLVVLLLIVGGVMAYGRLMPVLESRLRNLRGNGKIGPLPQTDGMIVDPDPDWRRPKQLELRRLKHPQFSSDETPQVEIVGPSEPSVTNWVTEAERKLRTHGRIQP
jgi:hypothetical protein